MSTELLIAIISLITGAIGYIVKALLERRALAVNALANQTNAQASDASATAVVIAAARELVDPLRKELALERQEHSAAVAAERNKLRQMRDELQSALDESRALRVELNQMRQEMDRMEDTYRRRITALEAELAKAKA